MGLGVLTVGLGLGGQEVQWILGVAAGSRLSLVLLCPYAVLQSWTSANQSSPKPHFFFPFLFFYNLNYPSASLSRCS